MEDWQHAAHEQVRTPQQVNPRRQSIMGRRIERINASPTTPPTMIPILSAAEPL